MFPLYQLKPYVVETELDDGSIKFCSTLGRSHILPSDMACHYKLLKNTLFYKNGNSLKQLTQKEKDCIFFLKDDLLKAELIEEKVSCSQIISNRYRSQMTFFSVFDGSKAERYRYYEKIREANVVILGMGGVGSHVAMALTLAGIGKLKLVDYDHVEETNLNEQFLYTNEDLGDDKTETAARKINQLNPDIDVIPINMEVASVEDVLMLIEDANFLCCSADFPFHYIYRWINEACVLQNVPWIQANSAEATGFIGPLVNPGKTSCYGCLEEHWRRNDPNYLFEIDQLNQDKTLYHNKASSLSAEIGMLGNFAALEIIKYITGFSNPKTLNSQISIEFGSIDLRTTNIKRLTDCPVCGHIKN